MLGIKRGLSLASRGEWPSDDEDDEDFELSGDEKESVLDISENFRVYEFTMDHELSSLGLSVTYIFYGHPFKAYTEKTYGSGK